MAQIEKSKVIEAMKKVMPGVEKGGSVIQGADSFLFTNGYIHTYNGNVAVSVPCDMQGLEFAVKAVDFYNLVNKLTELSISIEAVGNKVQVKAGKTKASLLMLDGTEIKRYVDSLNINGIETKDVPQDFADAARICAIKTGASSKGIAVQGSRIYSTDSIRVSYQELSADMDTFWVDDDILADALKLGEPKFYAVVSPWLHLCFENGVTFSAMMKDYSVYPYDALNRHIGNIATAEVLVSGRLPNAIAEAVNRVGVLAGVTAESENPSVKMTFSEEGVTLFASKFTGDAEELVPWDITTELNGYSPSVTIDVKFITEVALKAVEFKVIKIGNTNFLLFTSGEYNQLVCCS